MICGVAIREDGNRILTGGSHKKAVEWDVKTGEILQVFAGHTVPISSVATNSDGTRVLTGNGAGRSILWESSGVKKPDYFRGLEAAWSADRSRILTALRGKSAALWDANTGERLRMFEGHTQSVTAIDLSPNGNRNLTGSEDKSAILWDGVTGAKLQTLPGTRPTSTRWL